MKFVTVPKFIEREARVLGPITFRQLIILGIGGFILFLVYFLYKKFFNLALIIVGPITLALAFVQIQGMPILNFIANFFLFGFKRKIYRWGGKEETIEKMEFKKKKKAKLSLTQTQSKISSLKSRLEIK
jgi:hypothetical protein